MYNVIPHQVCFDPNLNAGAKLLYGNISTFTMNNRIIFASNKHFAKLYNVSSRTIQRWLEDLQKNGYITIEYKEVIEDSMTFNRRYIETTLKAYTNNEHKEHEVMIEAVSDYAKKASRTSDPGKYKEVNFDALKEIWQ